MCVLHTLRWRHNGRDSMSNNQSHDYLLNRLFRRRSKKTSKPRVTGLCAGYSPGTGELSAQMARNAETVSIWWHHHVCTALGRIEADWRIYASVHYMCRPSLVQIKPVSEPVLDHYLLWTTFNKFWIKIYFSQEHLSKTFVSASYVNE